MLAAEGNPLFGCSGSDTESDASFVEERWMMQRHQTRDVNNEWNKRLSKYADIKEELSFEQRLAKEGGREYWKDEDLVIPEDIPLTRVENWEGVLSWVEQQRSQGKL